MRAVVANAPSYAETSPVLSRVDLRDRVHVIPLGIDERSYPQAGDCTIHEKLGLASDEPYFLFVGVLRYYKGLHVLIQAAVRVGAKIVIAGTGPEESSLRAQAALAGIGNLVFAGQVSDEEKLALTVRCRALVLPSHLRSEAYGMVLVEAAMLGRPMVSCEIGTGTSFVNVHGETGLVVPAQDPGALADAMNCLLQDVLLAESMGRAARRRYERMFSGKALGREYARLFRECIAQ